MITHILLKKVMITGSRRFKDRRKLRAILRDLPDDFGILVHGGARGADMIAEEVGRSEGFEIEAYPVDTAIDGAWPRAGGNRNTRMIETAQPDYVIALPLPGSRGTWDAIGKVKARGIPYDIY